MDDWLDGWMGGLFCSGQGPRDRNLARATPHATCDAQKRIVCQKFTLTFVMEGRDCLLTVCGSIIVFLCAVAK
jgi:hypothetical protein